MVKGKNVYFVVVLLLAFSFLMSACGNKSSYSNQINSTQVSDETKSEVNFDLSKYTNHGKLSCGMIWVSEYQWDDKRDGSYEMFAYFDENGNKKSPWFNTEEYFTADYNNNFLILEEVKLKFKERKHSNKFTIYDLNGKVVEYIECREYDTSPIVPFNEYGYSFANANGNLLYIDKDGSHGFDKNVHSVNLDIVTTDKYFLVEGDYVCDHQGNLLVNVEKIVNDFIDSENNYKQLDYPDDKITLGKIEDGKSIEASFKAMNKTSGNLVTFNCVIGFDGKFIKTPSKS